MRLVAPPCRSVAPHCRSAAPPCRSVAPHCRSAAPPCCNAFAAACPLRRARFSRKQPMIGLPPVGRRAGAPRSCAFLAGRLAQESGVIRTKMAAVKPWMMVARRIRSRPHFATWENNERHGSWASWPSSKRFTAAIFMSKIRFCRHSKGTRRPSGPAWPMPSAMAAPDGTQNKARQHKSTVFERVLLVSWSLRLLQAKNAVRAWRNWQTRQI